MVFAELHLPGEAADQSGDEVKAAQVATSFINGYVQAIPRFKDERAAITWVQRSPLASANFKKNLETLYRGARRDDPEMGYGADAVVGGQDYPTAYEIKTVRVAGDRAEVHLVGVQPNPMPLRMVLIRHRDSWLVEGSGDLAR